MASKSITFMGRYVRQDFITHTSRTIEDGVIVYEESMVHNTHGVYHHTNVFYVLEFEDGTVIRLPRDDYKSLVRVG